MPAIINSDDGVVSGSSGLKTSGANDGITVFQQNGTESMRIDSSGNITVKDKIQFGIDAQTHIQAGGTSDVDLIVAADTNIRFETATNERMRIDSSGNVGIGASSPNSTLNVVGAQTTFDTNVFGQVLVRSTAAYNATPRAGVVFSVKYNSAGDYIAGGSSIQCYKQTANNGEFANGLLFTTQAEGQAPAERARIDSSGNLLVGTTSGSDRFMVKSAGTSSAASAITIQNSAGTELMRIRNDGVFYTGGATFSPYNNTTASAANVVVGASGDLFRSTSSLKYKQDVADATHGLAEVLQLRPVTYKGKSEADGDKVFGGLIAEEVHQAGLTEFVQYAEDGSPDAIAYGNMVSLCIKAIQELKAELDATKAEVAALKARTT